MLLLTNCEVRTGKYSDRSLDVRTERSEKCERHRLVHNGGFSKLEALYCSLNIVSSTKISWNLSYKVQSFKSQSLKPTQKL